MKESERGALGAGEPPGQGLGLRWEPPVQKLGLWSTLSRIWGFSGAPQAGLGTLQASDTRGRGSTAAVTPISQPASHFWAVILSSLLLVSFFFVPSLAAFSGESLSPSSHGHAPAATCEQGKVSPGFTRFSAVGASSGCDPCHPAA